MELFPGKSWRGGGEATRERGKQSSWSCWNDDEDGTAAWEGWDTLLVNQEYTPLWWSNRRMGIWGRTLVRLGKEAPQLIKVEGDMARDDLFISPSLCRCSRQSEFTGKCPNGRTLCVYSSEMSSP